MLDAATARKWCDGRGMGWSSRGEWGFKESKSPREGKCDIRPNDFRILHHHSCPLLPFSIVIRACPHHSCATCGRNTAAAGGLLFRCEACPNAFCEDCIPEEHEMVSGGYDNGKRKGNGHM